MKTQEQELQALDKQATEKRIALVAKYRILDKLGDLGEYAPPFVHYHNLYGSVGSINFRVQRYASIPDGKSPDLTLLQRLIEQFPPTSKVLVQNACKSFQPKRDPMPEPGIGWTNREQQVTDIAPITIDIDKIDNGAEAEFNWYADCDGELWEFKVSFYLSALDIGSLRYSVDRYPEGEVKRVNTCQFLPSGNAQVTKWASGDHKTPNHFTLHWEAGNYQEPTLFFKP